MSTSDRYIVCNIATTPPTSPRSGGPRVTTHRQDRYMIRQQLQNRFRMATETARQTIGNIQCAIVFVTADEKNLLKSKNECPEGTFPCKQGGCINRTLICNKELDCIDGSDEGNWCDPFLDDYWDRYIRKRPDADREDESAECSKLISIYYNESLSMITLI
ncbi:hypothetical protein LOTGIDRAFT_155604 [Lottia gigantea]|uniref:Uncharacterized protein n=1 Tax=Lottia gigantea TaxID=225164 RepID=V4B6U4_LOTGI|nr:hypothetical protein LOTGIDRAFT_155604 [Lottia gigantea]ESO84269.1 hypothetical protein LOTGIDRAFT_155604 [Lottia gigantea]